MQGIFHIGWPIASRQFTFIIEDIVVHELNFYESFSLHEIRENKVSWKEKPACIQ